MSRQPSFGEKINLNFFAEHLADPESAKIFLRNRGFLRAHTPLCKTCGVEMLKVEIRRNNATV